MKIERIAKHLPVLRPQARHHDGAYLNRLADSLVRGQLQPIGLLKDHSVIWGNARVLAARSKPEITHLWAAIFDEEVKERDFQRMRFIENQLRQDLSNAEKCINCVEYANSEPSMTLKEIAKDLGVDPSMVTRWCAWSNCIDLVRQALSCDSITLQTMYAISQLPPEQQEAGLSTALNGKKPRKSSGVKMSRVKIAMPQGASVVLSGSDLNMSDVVEMLSEVLKEAKKAAETFDVKTWMKMMADKAKG
jgi:hypothetical protein